ncbi:MAG: reverse transcriptase family protein [Deltaproteobacteria bacterium]|nr:reverse transcriptase family protein [Deltaproteobacteria bacterium]
MDLAKLLLTLRPLLSDSKANLAKITTLLEKSDGLAEFEIARYYAARSLKPVIAEELRAQDPSRRRAAADAIALTCTARDGAGLLRRIVKDPNANVRAGVRKALNQLGVQDTGLPDTRFPAPKSKWMRAGGWNETGWAFGIGSSPKKRKAARPTADIAAVRTEFSKIRTAEDLAKALGLESEGSLRAFMRPGSIPGSGYVEFTIPKATGGVRTICAPRAPLKRIQRAILQQFLSIVPSHPAAHGFVKKRSVVSNAAPHVGAGLVIKLDLVDFFPSVTFRRVCGTLSYLGMGDSAAWALAALITHRATLPSGEAIEPGVLPQGAPTSPAMTNIICRRMDTRLDALTRKYGGTYTRYADDLTFSFASSPDKGIGRFLWWVDSIIQQEGFTQNTVKRRVLRRSNQQRVTGVVVNHSLSVPRESRRRFRAVLENIRRTSVDEQSRGRRDFRAYLQGFASYVKMVQPEVGAALLAEVRAVLAEDTRKRASAT